MSNDPEQVEAGPQYEAAYEMHYTKKNLRGAISLYQSISTAHPDSGEAGYARSQIQNIVNAAVPAQVLMEAHAELALKHLEDPSEEPKVAAQAPESRVLVAAPDPGSDD